ncbi:ABC transporter permease [Chitinophaga sedimenti]|uniref:ABC transporter permease n=1 Tax=Chitinophaga sedimenti TaxID=2033606 RepID=UPI0020068293|nr:ABC transporter permease [Chitinophaga sedimenti]MCK7555586.1 ABC transporter permease [Chitinophaga sedimenti]
MFYNQIKIACRNLWKDKSYSFLNIGGLALAVTVFLFIIHYVRLEHSYEDIHTKKDHLYRITVDLYNGAEFVVTDCETYPVLGPRILRDFPEVKNYARVQHVGNTEVKVGETGYIVDRVFAADSQYFSLFNVDFVRGEKSSVLRGPNEAVISASTAERLFGQKDPLGQVITIARAPMTITGVFKDIPENTHLKFDMLLPFQFITQTDPGLDKWNSNNNYTYVELADGASLAGFNNKLRDLSKEKLRNEIMTAGPISDIHLHSTRSYEPEPPGNINTVNFLFVIAVLILLIGAINYINLTTARASERWKEAGIRKVMGATRATLIRQFLLESVIVNLAAFLTALLLVALLTPVYLQLVNKPMNMQVLGAPGFWWLCSILFTVNCLLSGLQPAFMMATVQPVAVLTRSTSRGGVKGGALRRVLVVGQFTVAVVVISFIMVIYRQLHFMRAQDKGVNLEQVLVVKDLDNGDNDSARYNRHLAMRESLLALPAVKDVARSLSLPGAQMDDMNTTSNVHRQGAPENGYNFYAYAVDAHFVPLMGIRLIAGHNFYETGGSDHDVMLNEEALRILGFESAEKAIGQKISYPGVGNVVGIMKNFAQRSVKDAALPMILVNQSRYARYIAVKLQTDKASETIAAVEKIWHEHQPGRAFNYFFLDQQYDRQYKADQQFGTIVSVFTIFSVVITCLGLLGLTAHSIARRTREIGIRKVLGASAGGIVGLFAKDYVKLATVAMFIGIPLAIWLQHQWLQDFALRATMPWWIYSLAGSSIVLVALITVGLQSVKAALVNPIKSLGE